MKAKSVYKFRRFFNQNYLRVIFDTFKIKVFANMPLKRLNSFMFNEDTLKLLKLHRVVAKNQHELRLRFFNTFVKNSNIRK